MTIVNRQWLSNKHFNGLGLDKFIGPDGSFQFSKNIDVRRNPKGFQLVPKVNITPQTERITAMLGISTNYHFNFGENGNIYLNNSLVYTLTNVNLKEILNATVFKNYIYILTKSSISRIKIADATSGNWGAIEEDYIDYHVEKYIQALDAEFVPTTVINKNRSGIVTNTILINSLGNTVSPSLYNITLLPSGYSQISASPVIPNGPFELVYDFTPDIGNFIPVLNYYDSIMYVGMKSYVLGYKPGYSALPLASAMMQFEDQQEIRALTAHGTQITAYCQVDNQNSRQYFRNGTGAMGNGSPDSIIHWDGVLIQNVGVYGNYDWVVSNDPRNEISYLRKTQGFERQLMHQGKKLKNNVVDGDFHCTSLNQNFVVKDEICYMPAEQGLYTTGNYYTGFNNAVVRERQRTQQMRAWCENLHNSYLYLSYQDKSDNKNYIAKIDMNYEFRPANSGTDAFEPEGELISRIFTGEKMYEEKSIKQIELAYEFEPSVAAPGIIDIYIRTDRKRPRLLVRSLNKATDYAKNFVRIDPNEIKNKGNGYIKFNMLERRIVLKRGSQQYTPVVYEVNVLYDGERPDNVQG